MVNDGAVSPTALDIPGFAGQCFWSIAASVLITHLHLQLFGFGMDRFEDKCSDKALTLRFDLQGSDSGASLQVY